MLSLLKSVSDAPPDEDGLVREDVARILDSPKCRLNTWQRSRVWHLLLHVVYLEDALRKKEEVLQRDEDVEERLHRMRILFMVALALVSLCVGAGGAILLMRAGWLPL
jgi:hypothetical protein